MATTPVNITGATTIVGFTVSPPFSTSDVYTFSFPYISQNDFEIKVNSETILDAADYEFTSDYLIQLTSTGVSKLDALYGTLLSVPLTIRRRTTLDARLVDFKDAATLTEADLDLANDQLFYLLQEVYDSTELGSFDFNPVDGSIDLDSAVLLNLGYPTGESAAATLGSVYDNAVTPDYTEGDTYRSGRLVFNGADLYRANTDILSAPAVFNAPDWDLVFNGAELLALTAALASIAANTAAIDDNILDIATNAADIDANTLDIATNTSDIATHIADENGHREIDTKANLETWVLTAPNGAQAFASDEKLAYQAVDNVLLPIGGGAGGGLDAFLSEDFATNKAASLTTGKDATFDNGGPLGGTLVDEEVSPLAGGRSIKYTTNATVALSDSDFFYLTPITLDAKQKNQFVGMTFYYTWDGSDDLIKAVIWDDTNNKFLSSSLDLIKTAGSATRFSTSVFIPASCNSIKVGFQHVGVSESSKVFIVDDIELSTNPFVTASLSEEDTVLLATTNAGQSITAGVTNIPFISSVDSSGSWDGSQFTVSEEGIYNIDLAVYFTTLLDRQLFLYLNGSSYKVLAAENNSSFHKGDYSGFFSRGDVLSIRVAGNAGTLNSSSAAYHYLSISKVGKPSEHVVTPAKSNMTDWVAYTPTTQGLGTASTNYAYWRRVGDSLSIMAKLTVGTPTAVEAQISLPSGLTIASSPSLTLQQVDGSVDRSGGTSSLSALATSGDTFLNLFNNNNSGVISANNGSVITGAGEVFTINAVNIPIQGWSSDVTFLAAVPVQKVAFLKDIKAISTDGGTFSGGTWVTRDLNTVEGDSEIVTLLGNQFTLQSGKYILDALLPAVAVNGHVGKIRNITDSSDALIGTASYCSSSDVTVNTSSITGILEIASPKTFELQHHCQTTKTTNGLGVGSAVVTNTFSQVKITKLR